MNNDDADSQATPNPYTIEELRSARDRFDATVLRLVRLNTNSPDNPIRSRELSVAITEAQTALLWLREAIEVVQ